MERFDIDASPSGRPPSAGGALGAEGKCLRTSWSPSHLGEPEDDFPPFTLIRHVIFMRLGLAPDQPLPGNRDVLRPEIR